MAVFSTNQVRQLYVAKSLKTTKVIPTDAAGSIRPVANTDKTHLYFEYKGADNLMRSDLIDIKNILSVKVTDANQMAHILKSSLVTLDAEVNEGNPIAGQDYILRIAFKQYVGMSDEDQYFKYGMVHAYTGMTASQFYVKLAMSLIKNFSREVTPLVKFYLESGDNSKTYDEVTNETKESSLTKTYTGIVIEEAEQPWRLGVMAQTPVYFEVQPTTVMSNGDDRIWGKVEDAEMANSISNGKNIADLEYFCMGERGDIYRGIGFPNNIPTTYLVDPDVKYNVIDIHYAYVGDNESVQKSEKDITIVVPKVGDTNAVNNKLANDIIAAINKATGLTITTLKTN